MISPPEQIKIKCPKCHIQFKAWHRPSINQQLDNFSKKDIEEMSTAVCPKCKQKISLDCLVVEKDGVWTMGQTKRTKKSQVTGNVGLYFVCYRLSLLGWNAMPTSRNARGIDILAYNTNCSRTISIQVKTLSKRAPVPLGNSIEKLMGDFWVIVNNISNQPVAFVIRPSEVYERAHRGEKNGKISYWLQPKSYELPIFREAWQRIGEP